MEFSSTAVSNRAGLVVLCLLLGNGVLVRGCCAVFAVVGSSECAVTIISSKYHYTKYLMFSPKSSKIGKRDNIAFLLLKLAFLRACKVNVLSSDT